MLSYSKGRTKPAMQIASWSQILKRERELCFRVSYYVLENEQFGGKTHIICEKLYLRESITHRCVEFLPMLKI